MDSLVGEGEWLQLGKGKVQSGRSCFSTLPDMGDDGQLYGWLWQFPKISKKDESELLRMGYKLGVKKGIITVVSSSSAWEDATSHSVFFDNQSSNYHFSDRIVTRILVKQKYQNECYYFSYGIVTRVWHKTRASE